MPAPDAIQEFRVVMNAYDSSIGRQAGGTIQMVTKSGTARLHGSLYEFNQNNVFNANTFQSNLVGAAESADSLQRIRRHHRRPGVAPQGLQRQAEDLLLLRLRRHPQPGSALRHALRLHRPRTQGRFLASPSPPPSPAASAPASRCRSTIPTPSDSERRPHALPRQRDSHQPPEQGGAEHPHLRAAAQQSPSDGTSTDANNFTPSSSRQNKMADISATRRPVLEQLPQELRLRRLVSRRRTDRATTSTTPPPAPTSTAWPEPCRPITSGPSSPTTILDLRANLARYEEPNNDKGVNFDTASLGFPSSFTASRPSAPSRASKASSAPSASARRAAWWTLLTTPLPAPSPR